MPSNKLPPERKEPTTFRMGPIDDVIFKPLVLHKDNRGWLVEIYRHDELPAEVHPVMAYISETLPGVARGPHEHAFQTDYFAFIGPSDFTLYLWDVRSESATLGNRIKIVLGESNKQSVVVPPGVVHAYKNTGTMPGWVLNEPNQLFAGKMRKEPVDEIRHEGRPDSPFVLD